MFSSKIHEQTIMEFSQGEYIAVMVESFLVDRKSAGLSQHTLKFYRQFLNPNLCSDSVRMDSFNKLIVFFHPIRPFVHIRHALL